MVQIIEEIRRPSAGERLAGGLQNLSNAATQFLSGMQQQQRQRSMGDQLSQIVGRDISSLPEQMQQEVLKSFLTGERESAKFQRELMQKPSELDESHDIAQKSFNRMAELVPSLGRGSDVLGFFGGKTAQKSGEFTSLTGALEALLVDKVNRGTLSNTRFKYITENLLPKPTDTRDMIRGKLRGLAQMLNLDPSALGEGKRTPGEKQRPSLQSFVR